MYPDGVDAVIDLVNRDPAGFAALVQLIRPGGRAASAVGGAGESMTMGDVSVANVGGNPDHLDALASLVEAGTVRVPVRHTYALAEAARGLADLVNEHTLGKLVVTVP